MKSFNTVVQEIFATPRRETYEPLRELIHGWSACQAEGLWIPGDRDEVRAYINPDRDAATWFDIWQQKCSGTCDHSMLRVK